ncbi:S24 family peptidase [Moritella sp.]|uniref:S24 family peptidase n=1 Tax=Moritella sp. TaxID=78556 RepID=UPI0025D4BED4|nr:S24 family peptidase [Moritella sp.]MCJ8348272.1 S24 family peptidase [Moritella sp.]
MKDIDEQIKELYRLTDTIKRSDLSIALGVSGSAIQNWRNRNKIPEHIFLKAQGLAKKVTTTPSGFIELPFYDIEVSAGHGALVACEERSEDVIFSQRFVTDTLGVNAKNIFLMPVRGDSMVPTLKNQSLIIVNRTDQIIEDGVYVFRYDGQLRVKRLQFSKNGITVVSDNPAYKIWELSKAELATEDFEIIGEVIWSGQRM